MAERNRKRLWLRLDNAAKIFPASMRRGWSNVFRLSAYLKESVSPSILEQALERIAPRFPSVCVRLGKGLFWYYLEEISHLPVLPEGQYPLVTMTRRDLSRSALRVLYYENRISVEFFHSITDGTGGLVFLKSLVAAYLELAYGVSVPEEQGVLSYRSSVGRAELEDAFLRYEGEGTPRESSPAFSLKGKREPDDFLHVTCASIPVGKVLALAREKEVTLTALLSAALIYCLAGIQRAKVAPRKEKAVRVQIPVNLRHFFSSRTLRNFVAVVNVGLEAGEGDASFDEILSLVHHQMALLITPRNLKGVFSANVESEKGIAIRLVPLFLKNLVMRAVFDRVGETNACLCLSNLGKITVPDEMKNFVTRFDFIIGTQAKAPYNCAVASYGDTLRIYLVRNTKEPELEQKFFPFLSSLGLPVFLESNER